MRRMAFKRGERIFTKGEPSDFAFLILSGTIEIILDGGQAADIIANLEAGEVFGEMGLIDSGPRAATAHSARENCARRETARRSRNPRRCPGSEDHYRKARCARRRGGAGDNSASASNRDAVASV